MDQPPPSEILQQFLNHHLQHADNDPDTEQLLRAAQQFLQQELQLAQRRPVIRFTWIFGLLPFMYIDFPALWQRCRSDQLNRLLGRFVATVAAVVLQVWRNILPIASVLYWLYITTRSILSLTTWMTFSNGFISDIVTYAVRNHPSILQHHKQLFNSSGADPLTFNKFGSVGRFVADNLAASVHIVRLEDDKIDFDRNSLIFRFSHAIATAYPISLALPPIFLTSCTIFTYITYGMGGIMLWFAIIGMISRSTVRRYKPFGELVIKLFRILFYQPNAAY